MRVEEHTIYLDESPVLYRSTPEAAGPPALYLHGVPTSSDDWVEFLARTGGVAPDLQGFGRSGKGAHLDYSLAGLTQFLERFLAEIQVDTVKLVAHDWGAAIALMLAERHPNRVERIVLFNAPPLFDGFAWPRPIRLWRTALVGEGLMGSTNRWLLARTLRQGSVRDDAWPDRRIATVWDQFDQGTQRAILRLVRDTAARRPAPSRTAPGRTAPDPTAPDPTAADRPAPETPALIIWGERDPWYPPALADAYAALLPGAHIERLSDAGHWPWLDRADLVDRVAAFLEQ